MEMFDVKTQKDINFVIENYMTMFGNHDDIYGRGDNIIVERMKGRDYKDRFLGVHYVVEGEEFVHILVDVTTSTNRLERTIKTIYDSRMPNAKFFDNLEDEEKLLAFKAIHEWFMAIDIRRIEYWSAETLNAIGSTFKLISDEAILVLPTNTINVPIDFTNASKLIFFKKDCKAKETISNTTCDHLAKYGFLYQVDGCYNSLKDLIKHSMVLKDFKQYKTMGKPVQVNITECLVERIAL